MRLAASLGSAPPEALVPRCLVVRELIKTWRRGPPCSLPMLSPTTCSLLSLIRIDGQTPDITRASRRTLFCMVYFYLHTCKKERRVWMRWHAPASPALGGGTRIAMNLRPAGGSELRSCLTVLTLGVGIWVWWHLSVIPWEMQTGALE